MALYKPKNLKPSIENGPVNIDTQKDMQFSFQLDGNEKLENYTLFIEDYAEEGISKIFTSKYSEYYLELESVGNTTGMITFNNRKCTYVDHLREKYPIFDATTNLTSGIKLNNLPKFDQMKITLDSIYYQHAYNHIIEGDDGSGLCCNTDILIPFKNDKIRQYYYMDYSYTLPYCTNIYNQSLIENKRVYSEVGLPVSINSNNSVFINSQQLYNFIKRPIAKSHFKEEMPFEGVYMGDIFGNFDWIYLKFKCDIQGNIFYYIKGFVPQMKGRKINEYSFWEAYLSDSYQYGVLKVTDSKTAKYLPTVRNHWHWKEMIELDTSIGEWVKKQTKIYSYNKEANDFFGKEEYKYKHNYDKDLIFPIKLKESDEALDGASGMLELGGPGVSIKNFYLSTTPNEQSNLNLKVLKYPIDSNGNNEVFDIDKSPINLQYNQLYLDKKGFVNWWIKVEGEKNEVTSYAESFLGYPDFQIALSTKKDETSNEVSQFKNISIYPTLSCSFKNDEDTQNTYALTSIANGLKPYNNKGEPWSKKSGKVYYKIKGALTTSDDIPTQDFYIGHDYLFSILKETYNSNSEKNSNVPKENIDCYVLKDGNSIFLEVHSDDLYYNVFLGDKNYSDKKSHSFYSSTTDNNSKLGYYISSVNLAELETIDDLTEIVPEISDLISYKYKIIDTLTSKIIQENDTVYTGDLNFSIDFLPKGNYRLEVEVENSLGMIAKNSIDLLIDAPEVEVRKPNLTSLKDSGVYIDWSNIPFLYASFSKGEFIENDFYYNYPVAPIEGSSAEYYKSLYIPKNETLTMNLLGQPCNYIVYCFQPVGQSFGLNEETLEMTTREVMVIQTDTYWYRFSICMVDKNNSNSPEGKYSYYLNVKAFNQDLNQLSASKDGEEQFIEFNSNINLITSEQLYYIMIFDKENSKIHLKLYYNINDSNLLDGGHMNEIDFSWTFEDLNINSSIEIPREKPWEYLFSPKYIQLLGEQVCSYIYGSNSIAENIGLVNDENYNAEKYNFYFNPNRTEKYDIIAEDKTKDELSNITIIRQDLNNDNFKMVYNIDNYTNKFIDYSVPSKTECFYELYIGKELSAPYKSEIIKTDDLGKWFLLVCDDVWNENGLNENKVTVADIFEFEANVTVGSMNNNTDFSISKNFTRYPKVQHSPSNYWSGTLGGLLGVISSGSRFTQTPEMLRRFKALTTDNRRKFLKDRDGNLWEISLSAANTVETNTNLDIQLKTANISWVEVADTVNTMIYLDNYTDATWLQEEESLVSGPYNGRTQF